MIKKIGVKEFTDKGISVTWRAKLKSIGSNPKVSCYFKYNDLTGKIHNNTSNKYIIVVRWGKYRHEYKCLSTTCKSIDEAMHILYNWFKWKFFAFNDDECYEIAQELV